MKRVYAATFIFAYCSMAYELILAQCMSIALGNTVQRYATTIGLYIFSLGLGALAVYPLKSKHPLNLLIQIEVVLAILGLSAPFLIFTAGINPYLIVLAIGLLSGTEVPLLMRVIPGTKTLGLDYCGTFVATLVFPLWIHTHLGIVAGTALTAILNAGTALWIGGMRSKTPAFACSAIILVSAACIYWEEDVRALLLKDF